jgi:hypothetical protein
MDAHSVRRTSRRRSSRGPTTGADAFTRWSGGRAVSLRCEGTPSGFGPRRGTGTDEVALESFRLPEEAGGGVAEQRPNRPSTPTPFDHPMSRGRRPEPSRQVFRLGAFASDRPSQPIGVSGHAVIQAWIDRIRLRRRRVHPRRRFGELPNRSALHGGASAAVFHRLPSSRSSRRPGPDPGEPRTNAA